MKWSFSITLIGVPLEQSVNVKELKHRIFKSLKQNQILPKYISLDRESTENLYFLIPTALSYGDKNRKRNRKLGFLQKLKQENKWNILRYSW